MQKILSFDVLRVIALLQIVLVHASAYVVIYYPDTNGSEFILGNILNGISRAGVPIFVMLSGALLLNEEHKFTPAKFFKKSYQKLLFLTCGWTLFFALFFAYIMPAIQGKAGDPSEVIDYILYFKGSDCPHLWYMYMILGLYLVIPVLRFVVKKENEIYVKWMIVACLLYHFTANSLNILTVCKERH